MICDTFVTGPLEYRDEQGNYLTTPNGYVQAIGHENHVKVYMGQEEGTNDFMVELDLEHARALLLVLQATVDRAHSNR